jgi:hypothetical protein
MAYSGERLPRVQQVRRSAHGAAGSGLPGGADTPGGTGRPAAGTDAGSRAHAPALRAAGLASASRREAAHGCAPGAVRRMRSAKPFAPRSFCAWRAQRRSHNASGPPASAGGARSARARAGRDWRPARRLASPGRASVTQSKAQWRAEQPPGGGRSPIPRDGLWFWMVSRTRADHPFGRTGRKPTDRGRPRLRRIFARLASYCEDCCDQRVQAAGPGGIPGTMISAAMVFLSLCCRRARGRRLHGHQSRCGRGIRRASGWWRGRGC